MNEKHHIVSKRSLFFSVILWLFHRQGVTVIAQWITTALQVRLSVLIDLRLIDVSSSQLDHFLWREYRLLQPSKWHSSAASYVLAQAQLPFQGYVWLRTICFCLQDCKSFITGWNFGFSHYFHQLTTTTKKRNLDVMCVCIHIYICCHNAAKCSQKFLKNWAFIASIFDNLENMYVLLVLEIRICSFEKIYLFF